MDLPQMLNPTPRFLMGPGPSDVHPRVLRAMATPVVGHLDPGFLGLMNEVKSMLRTLLRTDNDLTYAVSGTGSAGMETCFVNLLEPGDTVVVCVNGVFGNRMCDVAERCGAVVARVDAPWGQPVDPLEVEAALEEHHPKVLAVVHAETSTGVQQPLEDLGQLARDNGALFLVDGVTSLGGTDVRVDDWGIDAFYSGTQKCLSAPPGLAPVSFSPRAVEVMENRENKVQSWYLDMTMVRKYWGAERVYHHTAPITSIYGLHEALRLVLEEGLEARFARHQRHHALLRDGLERLGFEFVVEEPFRLPMLNAVRLPKGVEDAPTRKALLDEYNIEVGAGLGEFAGKVWRIGLMGNSCTANHVNLLLAALGEILAR